MSKTQLVKALEQGNVVTVKNLQDLAMQHANALDKVKAWQYGLLIISRVSLRK